MIPNASEITRRRVSACTVIRLIAVITLLAACLPMGSWFIEGIINGNLFKMNYCTMFNIVSGSLTILLGLMLWFIAPQVARLCIPVPRFDRCPGCQYRIQGISSSMCPECGLALTDEFLSGNPPEPARRAESGTIFLRQIAASVLRLAAACGALITLIIICYTSMVFIRYSYVDLPSLVGPVASFFVILPFYIFAPFLAVNVVPSRAAMRKSSPRILLSVIALVIGVLMTGVSLSGLVEPGIETWPFYTLLTGGIVLIVCGIPTPSFLRKKHPAPPAGPAQPESLPPA